VRCWSHTGTAVGAWRRLLRQLAVESSRNRTALLRHLYSGWRLRYGDAHLMLMRRRVARGESPPLPGRVVDVAWVLCCMPNCFRTSGGLQCPAGSFAPVGACCPTGCFAPVGACCPTGYFAGPLPP
jgi:hypothetical protein